MVVCIGESLIDFVPQDGGGESTLPRYRPVAGGCPYNCAVAVSRLGSDVSFAGAISTDFFGDFIAARLEANGVGLSLVHRVDRPTTLAFVKKAADGSARYAFYTKDAADRALSRELLPELAVDAILQIGSISIIADSEGDAILHLAEREHGRRVIAFDPNIRESLVDDERGYRERIDRALRAATLLKTSDEDLAWIYPGTSVEDGVRRALDAGVELVVVTRGAEGSTAYTTSCTATAAAESVEVSDTIGAGDSFLAALLVWLDERDATPQTVASFGDEELGEALEFASKVAAITCTRVGADPPTRDEVRRW